MAVRRGPGTSARAIAPADPVDPVLVGRARDLLDRAEILMDNADGVPDAAERFRQYYLAALRAAGAALAVHEPPGRTAARRGSPNAWSRIALRVPELADYADEFARLSGVRMNIETGLTRDHDIEVHEVTRLRTRVFAFLDDVEAAVTAYEQGKHATRGTGIGHTA
ncbi:hypothetical protein GCM10009624_33240 [Gordonia sinesedis]